ncbi:MFS transporter [Allocoprobacillus halotolerans]|uniref:MFS transporter n=1 Tax=Allocoprobacillus halotolerans TaxID=2944914 RepID=A0ABY5I168_9FIRM|nr:MFS transporter [Allocoprobacillus halotolerans]UTY39066.1 MFS transporter [Allocoprobacillus halotolerans]
MIYVAQLMQMGAYALFIPSAVYYVKKKMYAADINKGQSLVTMAMTLSEIFANLIGGVLLDIVGVRSVLLIGVVIFVIGSIIVLITTKKA